MMYLQSKKPFYYITGNYSNIQGFKKTVKKNKKYPKKGLQFVGNRYIVIITNICLDKDQQQKLQGSGVDFDSYGKTALLTD